MDTSQPSLIELMRQYVALEAEAAQRRKELDDFQTKSRALNKSICRAAVSQGLRQFSFHGSNWGVQGGTNNRVLINLGPTPKTLQEDNP